MFDAPQNILLLLAALLAALGGYTDLRRGIVPNRAIVLGLAAGLCARVLLAIPSGFSGLVDTLLAALLGAFVCAFVPALLCAVQAMGAGDVKLLGACGFLLGPVAGCELALYAFGFGSIYALLRFSFDGSLFRVLGASAMVLTNAILPSRFARVAPVEALGAIRFAPAIALSASVVLALGWRSV